MIKHFYNRFLLWYYLRQDTLENFISICKLFKASDIDYLHLLIMNHCGVYTAHLNIKNYNEYVTALTNSIKSTEFINVNRYVCNYDVREASLFFIKQDINNDLQSLQFRLSEFINAIAYMPQGKIDSNTKEFKHLKVTLVAILRFMYRL